MKNQARSIDNSHSRTSRRGNYYKKLYDTPYNGNIAEEKKYSKTKSYFPDKKRNINLGEKIK